MASNVFDRPVSGSRQELSSSRGCVRFGGTRPFTVSNSILVNKAKPLDPRLINELLPEVDTVFPRDLSSRKVPSEPGQPPWQMSPRLSVSKASSRGRPMIRLLPVVIDSALIKAIRNSASPARSVRSRVPTRRSGDQPGRCRCHVQNARRVLDRCACRVSGGLGASADRKSAYAFGRHRGDEPAYGPHHVARSSRRRPLELHASEALSALSRRTAAGTSGKRWQDLQRDWNEIQNVGRDIKLLVQPPGAPQITLHAFAKVA